MRYRLFSLFLFLTIILFFQLTNAVGRESTGSVSGTYAHASSTLMQPPTTMRDSAQRESSENDQIKVFVSFFLIDILNINTAEQTFNADFRLQLRWHDPRLASSSPENSAQKHYNLADVWYPKVRFINGLKIETVYDGFLEIDESGFVNFIQRYSGDFAVKLALKDFPRDIQNLSITMISGRHDDDIEFVFDPTWSGMNEDLTIADWSITPQAAESTPISFSSIDASQTVNIPAMIFQFKARRHAGYYTWKVIIPLTLIVLMAFTVFYIDPAELGAQVTISTASVITVIAFQFSLGILLPKISYLTRIDTFILGSTIFVFLALAESIVTSAVSLKNGNKLARKIDLWSRWLFPASFFLLFLISFLF